MSNDITGPRRSDQPYVGGPSDSEDIGPANRNRRSDRHDFSVGHRQSGPNLDGGVHDDFEVSGSYGNLGKAMFDDYNNSQDILSLYSEVQAELHKVNKERQKSAHENAMKQLGAYNDAVDQEVDDLDEQAKGDFSADMWSIGVKGAGSIASWATADPNNQAKSMAIGSLGNSLGGIPEAVKSKADIEHSGAQKLAQKVATNAQTFLQEFQDTVRDGQSTMSKSLSDLAETQSSFRQSMNKAADMS